MAISQTLSRPLRDTNLIRNVVTAVLAVFFLSVAIHIIAVLLVPRFATNDGWSRLYSFAETGRFKAIPNDGKANLLSGLDPLFVHSVCAISLAEAPAALSLTAEDSFWSLSLYDSKSIAIFSLNDRTAQGGTLDMLVVSPVQNALLKESPPPDIDDIVLVEATDNNLVAVFRLYAPNSELRQKALSAVNTAICEPDV